MKFVRQIERINQLNKLIENKCTGCPKALANRLGIQRSTLYETLDYLKALGLDIAYDRSNQTFYYTSTGKLELYFSFRILKDSELTQTNGGFSIVFVPSIFSGRNKSILVA